jgi:protein-S-isoprenylcysteine O-methyltransferase Ste14
MRFLSLTSARRVLLARVLVATQFSILLSLGVIGILNISKPRHNYLLAEMASIIMGLLIIAAAGYSLKPSLRISPIPKADSPLIESGIYHRVRHPMYLAVILIGFGMAGYSDSGVAWILEVILIVDLNIKARFEDALLLEAHPEAFHYQMHVSRILPCMGGSCKSSCVIVPSKD